MKVKRLIWDIDRDCKTGVIGETLSATGNIKYAIRCDYEAPLSFKSNSVYNVFIGYRLFVGFGSYENIALRLFDTIDEAKEYAQKHYENLILSGLVAEDES